jgi:hypothetical protein
VPGTIAGNPNAAEAATPLLIKARLLAFFSGMSLPSQKRRIQLPSATKVESSLTFVFFTIKQRGLNPVDTVKKALKIYIKTGNLPPLAEFTASHGYNLTIFNPLN